MDPPEAEIARPEVVAQSKSTGMTLRSQSRENRSKVTVRTDIHSESTGFATRPEPEVARRETEIAPVAGPSLGDIAAVSSRSQSVESGNEAGVEPQSGYPLPARQEPEVTAINFHTIANPTFLISLVQSTRSKAFS